VTILHLLGGLCQSALFAALRGLWDRRRGREKATMPKSSVAAAPAGLLNVKQLAAALGISVSTVKRLVAKDQIPSVVLGRWTRRFDLAAVREALVRGGAAR